MWLTLSSEPWYIADEGFWAPAAPLAAPWAFGAPYELPGRFPALSPRCDCDLRNVNKFTRVRLRGTNAMERDFKRTAYLAVLG